MGLEMILTHSFKMLGLNEDSITQLVDQASNGQEALDMVKTNLQTPSDGYSYGIIFMDCSMPIMDGYKSSIEIRKFYKHHRVQQPLIVALTGHTEDVYISKAFSSKMDEVVPKPANVEVVK
jgi:CheY-like chemotaxis protein